MAVTVVVMGLMALMVAWMMGMVTVVVVTVLMGMVTMVVVKTLPWDQLGS